MCCIGCDKGGLCYVGVVVPSDSLEGGGIPGLDELGFQWSWFLCDLHAAGPPVPGQLVLSVRVQGIGVWREEGSYRAASYAILVGYWEMRCY